MSNGYGFHTPGTRPSPDPRQVGQMLMQGPQAQPQQPQAPRPMAPQMTGGREAEEAPARSMDEHNRREGAKLMGAGGPDEDGALAAAVGEALTRAGNGHRGNPNPYKNRARNLEQLKQLGVSEFEASLLGEVV